MSSPRSRRRTDDPLDGTAILIVDGTNLLHRLRREAGSSAVPPAATLIGRLRGVVPAQVQIDLVLDGPPDPGSRDLRVASGVTVRFAGKLTADALIARLVGERASRPRIEPGHGGGADPSTDQATHALDATLVVTDDTELATTIRRLGARVAPGAWLLAQLGRARLVSPTVARPRPPQPPQLPQSPQSPSDEERDRRGWRPGRGATAKRGNPRRGSSRGGRRP